MYIYSFCMSIILTIQFLNLCARFYLNNSKMQEEKEYQYLSMKIFAKSLS